MDPSQTRAESAEAGSLRETELSVSQAADILSVSDAYLEKLLETRQLPFRETDGSRRVRYEDLVTFSETYQKAADAALDEMTRNAEDAGLYARDLEEARAYKQPGDH